MCILLSMNVWLEYPHHIVKDILLKRTSQLQKSPQHGLGVSAAIEEENSVLRQLDDAFNLASQKLKTRFARMNDKN
jgi:hypothetical protein